MSHHERTFKRCSAWSKWHREDLPRLAGVDEAEWLDLCAIDLDHVESECVERDEGEQFVEWDRGGKILGLVEVARGTWQTNKRYRITQKLANQAGIKALCVLYEVGSGDVITQFRVKRIAPAEGQWVDLSPSEFANALLAWRHSCGGVDLRQPRELR